MDYNIAYQQLSDGYKPKRMTVKQLLVCSLFPISLLLLSFVYFTINTPDSFRSWRLYQKQIINKVFTFKHEYCYDDITNTSNPTVSRLEKGVEETSIFFIETRCHQTTEDVLTERQACAVESAAFTNPDMTVYVLFASETPFDAAAATPHVKRLLEYGNIKLRHIRLAEYMEGTPLDRWYGEGALKKSGFPLVHISDVLRLVTLWKFGGIYLDLDTVTMKSLKGVIPFAAIANNALIGNAALGSSKSGIGHSVLTLALERLRDNFQSDVWGANGPVLITDVLRYVCAMGPEESIHRMNKERCQDFNVFPAKYFHPIPYYNWRQYFSTGKEAAETLKAVNESYTIHLWNKMSHDELAIVGSEQPYAHLAKQFCPLVYESVGDKF